MLMPSTPLDSRQSRVRVPRGDRPQLRPNTFSYTFPSSQLPSNILSPSHDEFLPDEIDSFWPNDAPTFKFN